MSQDCGGCGGGDGERAELSGQYNGTKQQHEEDTEGEDLSNSKYLRQLFSKITISGEQ